MEPLNRTAPEFVDEAIDFADEFRIAVHRLKNEAIVLDFRVETPGGFEAGLLLVELRRGGLAIVSFRLGTLDGGPHHFVEVETDNPRLALLESQRAGWALPEDAVWASGSGKRLRVGGPDRPADPEEKFDIAVLGVE